VAPSTRQNVTGHLWRHKWPDASCTRQVAPHSLLSAVRRFSGIFKTDMYDYYYHYCLSVNFWFHNWSANYIIQNNLSEMPTSISIQPLLYFAIEDLFCKMKSSNHCVHPLLPPDRTLNQVLRTRGHSFQLPTCSFNLHKKSFVISCLFKFLTRVCSCFLCVLFFMFKLFFSKCFSNFLSSRLTFALNFCPLLLLTTNYVLWHLLIYFSMHVCCCYSINCIVL